MLCGIASKEQVYTALPRVLQYVVTSFNRAVAISVPLPGINPNSKSFVLLSSRTYISKNFDKVVDMTIGLQFFGTDVSHPAFFGMGNWGLKDR